MVIDDLDISRAGRPFRPCETYPPLVIDPNAILPFAAAFEGFQPIAGKSGEVGKICRRVEPVEPYLGLTRETGKRPNVIAFGELFGSFVPVADDH